MQPLLPVEILQDIVDLSFANDSELTGTGQVCSASMSNLLATSKVLRICALRNLCKTIVVDCDDRMQTRRDKLRHVLIPDSPIPPLDSIAPFVRTLQISPRYCSAAVDDVCSLLAFACEWCPLDTLIIDALHSDENYPSLPNIDTDFSIYWRDMQPKLCVLIRALLRLPSLSSLKLLAVEGITLVARLPLKRSSRNVSPKVFTLVFRLSTPRRPLISRWR